VEERQPHSQDDLNDTFLFEKLQEHVLENYPNPNRIGCFDHATLETWVFHPERLDLSDPKYLHVLKCAECTHELLELRKLKKEKDSARAAASVSVRTRPSKWVWATAAILLCCLAIGGLAYWRIHSQTASTQGIPADPIAMTIDLSQAGTTRGGGTSTVPPVALPRRVISAHILLPYFSPGGNYNVSVTMDRNGGHSKVEGQGIAKVNGFHADLTVSLDLRALPEGTYYLATTHEGDQASYYYPLTVH
jgi:hypothetical protein